LVLGVLFVLGSLQVLGLLVVLALVREAARILPAPSLRLHQRSHQVSRILF
jgi:hypothetical protein